MFILEESQLIEDNIKNPSVLKLYQILRQQEPRNERTPIVDEILANEKCQLLTELVLKFYLDNGHSLVGPPNEDKRFTQEQRDELYCQLNLEQSDVASLALIISASLTHLFVIDNFVGPTSNEILQEAYAKLPDCMKDIQNKVDYTSLSRDGSEVYHKVVSPWLLRLVQLYWHLLTSLGCSRRLLELEFLVWKQRYLTVHLMVLLEPSESMVSELRKLQEFIFDHHIINEAKENKTQLVRFNILELCCELVQSSLLRDGITFCRKFYDYASEISGLSIEHTGVLGKRTKFQQNDIPQLVVKVTKKSKEDENNQSMAIKELDGDDASDLPLDVQLDDDTLLPDIAFISNDKEKGEELITEQVPNIEAQLLMLTNLDIILKSEVMEESLKDEWTLAYLRSIVKTASIWVVKYKALCLRSLVERKHSRRMDRALRQLEDLIKEVEAPSKNDGNNKRMRSFYSVLPQSSWQMQRSLGDMSFELGLFKNALEVYLRIEYWEGIIKCHCALNQNGKAERIIRQELAKNETPYLFCLLGDVTDDIECYEKSWALSKGRFARAKKSIGTYHYVRKEYAVAIENYELALSANPSNVGILSLLAYSCLTTERYERAAECYRNITYQDDTNFLAWNNLSKCYIQLNQKERAWRTLREAIKCNYEEWKIWENFMIVSCEIGALDDVITAWHRIIDIKSSHKDDQILSALTYALVKRPIDKDNTEYIQLLNDALKLIARLQSTSDCSPRLWVCYYKLLIREFELSKAKESEDGKQLTKLDIDSRVSKITNALQRATPSTLKADSDWLKVPEKINRLLNSYDELIDCYRFALDVIGPEPELWRQWQYFKLTWTNVVKALEKTGYRRNE